MTAGNVKSQQIDKQRKKILKNKENVFIDTHCLVQIIILAKLSNQDCVQALMWCAKWNIANNNDNNLCLKLLRFVHEHQSSPPGD